MKTFKIIGVTALLIVLFEFIGGFNDGWSDVDKLAPISIESADPAFDKVTATTFDVLPDSAIQPYKQPTRRPAQMFPPDSCNAIRTSYPADCQISLIYCLVSQGWYPFMDFTTSSVCLSLSSAKRYLHLSISDGYGGEFILLLPITWLNIYLTGVKPVMPWHNLQFRGTPSSPHLLLSSVG